METRNPFQKILVLARARVLVLALVSTGVVMATEEPAFTVEKKYGQFEVRRYGETLVAETRVNDSFDGAGSQAFGRLAGYIFGGNVSKTKIAMTAPVTQSGGSEKIAMTAPVGQTAVDGGYLVQFTMPAGYTLETLPTPKDPSVTLRAIPSRRVAVLRYSGGWSESMYQEKRALLQKEMAKENLVAAGEAVFARFNAPWQIWFLKRNEVWVPLRD